MLSDIVNSISRVLTGFSVAGDPQYHDGLIGWFQKASEMLLNFDLVKFILALAIIGIMISLVISIISDIKNRNKKPTESYHRVRNSRGNNYY